MELFQYRVSTSQFNEHKEIIETHVQNLHAQIYSTQELIQQHNSAITDLSSAAEKIGEQVTSNFQLIEKQNEMIANISKSVELLTVKNELAKKQFLAALGVAIMALIFAVTVMIWK